MNKSAAGCRSEGSILASESGNERILDEDTNPGVAAMSLAALPTYDLREDRQSPCVRRTAPSTSRLP